MSAVKKLMDAPSTVIKVDLDNLDVDKIKAAIKALLWLMLECDRVTDEDFEEVCDDEGGSARGTLRLPSVAIHQTADRRRAGLRPSTLAPTKH